MKRIVLFCTLALTSLAAYGCSEDRPSPTEMTELQAAFGKTGGGGGSTTTDPTAAFYLPDSNSSGTLGLWGDGNYTTNNPFSGTSRYLEKECGVNSKIFATTAASNSGDAIMHTSNNRYSDNKCKDYPRKVNISYAHPADGLNAGSVETTEVFVNVNRIQSSTYLIPVGATVKRALLLDPKSGGRCEQVRFRAALQDGSLTGADSVYVTRLDGTTWKVETRPGEDKAFCTTDGRLYHMPVSFHIRASRGLPTE